MRAPGRPSAFTRPVSAGEAASAPRRSRDALIAASHRNTGRFPRGAAMYPGFVSSFETIEREEEAEDDALGGNPL